MEIKHYRHKLIFGETPLIFFGLHPSLMTPTEDYFIGAKWMLQSKDKTVIFIGLRPSPMTPTENDHC